MTLPADAQAHLLVAFELHIPEDALIPAATRYRMYAERVVHHPLSSWQALTLDEARAVYKALTKDAAPPTPALTSLELDVLARVLRHRPLNRDDHAEVVALTKREFLHVTPEFDRTDKCPYRLTPAGEDALRQGRGA